MCITYSEYVFVALVKQHAKGCAISSYICRLWTVWLYNIFPHYLINVTVFARKVIEY